MLWVSRDSPTVESSKELSAHHNNFGALRLILAYAVILSHSPEMLDGNRLRESFIAIGYHNTLGGFAVDGFFIISGYLIASSYLSKPLFLTFLSSRILRIYPAFCVAYLLCIFVVGPISGGTLGTLGFHGWLTTFAKMFFLKSPTLPGAFNALRVPSLDGSMWTILYEFRCYILVGVLGALGWLSKRWIVLGLTVIFYTVSIAILVAGAPLLPGGLAHNIISALIGEPAQFFPLTAIFMSGVSFRLFRDVLSFRTIPLLLAAALCAVGASSVFCDLVVGFFGTYCLLWLSTGFKVRLLQRINNGYDYSYGIYLYAWPIASLAILYSLHSGWTFSPLSLTILTAILSTIAGIVSWYLVERAMLKMKPTSRINRLKTT